MPKTKKQSPAKKLLQNRQRKKTVRENLESKLDEQQKNTESHANLRQNPEFRESERERDREYHTRRRSDEVIRAAEQESNTEAHRINREDPGFRSEEQDRDRIAHASRRTDPFLRAIEQERNTEAHKSHREDPEFRLEEREKDKSARKSRRSDDVIRAAEQQINTIAHKVHRDDPEFRTQERENDRLAHSIRRSDPVLRASEQEQNTEAHKDKRQDAVFREGEKKKDQVARQKQRSVPEKRKAEQETLTQQRRKKRKERTIETLCSDFQAAINDYPNQVCVSCGRCMYRYQVQQIKLDVVRGKYGSSFLETALCHKNVSFDSPLLPSCGTCKSNIVNGRIPRLSLSNGFEFPEIPTELKDLTELEERLVAFRIPFMQIRNMQPDGQSKLLGSIVNVETDLNLISRSIPRAINDTATIQLRLMRKQSYKRAYMQANIRPWYVHKAGEYLCQQSAYKDNSVELSSLWANARPVDVLPIESPSCEDDENDVTAASNENAPTENDQILGADDTLLFNELDYSLTQTGIQLAPGEGKTPIPLFRDIAAEELSFPKIYCGKTRAFKENLNITYTDIAKSELLRDDPRACTPTKVLYAFKKSYNEKVRSSMQIYLRKIKGSDKNYSAAQMRNKEFVANLMRNDEGYAVWKNLRSSPSYWQEKCKKAVAMVRQQGKCTFFITFSAAEKKWPELLAALHHRATGTTISLEDAFNLTNERKMELIRNDPVLCMRQFDMRFKALKKNLLLPENGVFGPYKMTDYLNRTEFQMRGSPHMHGIYWLENAPQYVKDDDDSRNACISFIDQFITCSRVVEDSLKDVLPYQIHKHSNTCRKRTGKSKCRFGFPKPPLESTMILEPLDPSCERKKRLACKAAWDKIESNLTNRGRNPAECPSFDEFLSELDMSNVEYIEAIQSTLKRPTVLYKRAVDEAFVNPYNSILLNNWRANIDIQFVLDTYACAKYCVGYIMRADGGLSKTIREINNSLAHSNSEIQSKLERFSKMLWTGTEISAQEAAGFLLGIQNTDCSRQDIFVNTSHPNERTYMLKSKKELDQLEPDSENVVATGLLYHYSHRSALLEDCCLADISTRFEFAKKKPKRQEQSSSDEDPEQDNDEHRYGHYYQQQGEVGYFRERKGKRKILRFAHFMEKKDPENFLRERLMLFIPWRDEMTEICGLTFEDKKKKYAALIDVINQNKEHYFSDTTIDDHHIRALVDDQIEDDFVDDFDDQFEEEIQEQITDAALSLGLTSSVIDKVQQFLPPMQMNNEDYHKLMQTLNHKQQKFVLNVLHLCKTQEEAFYIFLSGGAGVGKSHVISAIVQSTKRYFDGLLYRQNLAAASVIVSAFTGKAAFNVCGMTLHTTFKLPPSQLRQLTELDADSASSLAAKLKEVRLFIIDEISMVSLQHLKLIDMRLRQIFRTNSYFGGRSVLVVGHLRQLKPICGSNVFTGQYGAPNPLWNLFSLFELDEIMRQRGDYEFCKALNAMSECVMDEGDIALIRSRQISTTLKPPAEAIWLFRTNAECSKHNAKVHSSMTTVGYVTVAKDRIEGRCTPSDKRRILELAKNLSIQDSDGLRYSINLQVGCEYFVSTNISVQDGLFNGATGTLKQVDVVPSAADEHVVARAWLHFTNPNIGTEARKAFLARHPQQKQLLQEHIWTPIERLVRVLSKQLQNGLKICRSQIPLVPCNGMTIAKSQGSSMPNIVVNLAGKKLQREELYVSCSRATSINGLFLNGPFFAPKLPPNDYVGNEMERMRNTRPCSFKLMFLQDISDLNWKVYFHNVQSLHAHLPDLKADKCAMAADVLILVEPHLLLSDEINIPNFKVVHRQSGRATRRGSDGIVILTKTSISLCTATSQFFEDSGHRRCYVAHVKLDRTNIIAVYKHPAFDNKMLIDLLENHYIPASSTNHVFIGDFNVNVHNTNGTFILDFFEQRGYPYMLDKNAPSTNAGTCIDLCFSNDKNLHAFYYESYYSIHKPICFYFPKSK